MTDLRVFWTISAISDLETIYEFLGVRSVDAAANQINDILKREEQLRQQPASGAVQMLKNTKEDYRYLVEGNYKIVYHIEEHFIYIDAVFDTRQDPENLKP